LHSNVRGPPKTVPFTPYPIAPLGRWARSGSIAPLGERLVISERPLTPPNIARGLGSSHTLISIFNGLYQSMSVWILGVCALRRQWTRKESREGRRERKKMMYHGRLPPTLTSLCGVPVADRFTHTSIPVQI
ncbi:hypothetical protein CI238_04796, partial [Colletotrichum incanum]